MNDSGAQNTPVPERESEPRRAESGWRLTTKGRALLRLYEGRSVEEIARELGISLDTARSWERDLL